MSDHINTLLTKARPADQAIVWQILQKAIQRRRDDGSNQWQNGYPNKDTVASDIERGIGYLLTLNGQIIAYCAILINDEPAYDHIEGNWLSTSHFLVVHRVAVAEEFLGKGWIKVLFRQIEELAARLKIGSVKVDTNYDNHAMLSVLEKGGYAYCGQVYFSGSPRKAFEKIVDHVFVSQPIQIHAITPRLFLREILPEDAADMYEMDADPEVHRYIENNPITSLQEEREVIEKIRKQYAENGIGRWAVIDKLSAECLGWCGIKWHKETMNGRADFFELGYRFKQKHWGKGYASEAAGEVLRYGFDILRASEIVALNICGNHRSERVLTKLGFVLLHEFQEKGILHHWFALDEARYRLANP